MSRRFFVTMGVSSALSLARGFVVASSLPTGDFGLYASLFALGVFCSSLLGMGRIEGTMKSFPRAWADGEGQRMCREADALARLVTLRAGAVALALALALSTAGHVSFAGMAATVGGIAAGTAAVGIYASALRATGNLQALGRANLLRACAALALCWMGAAWGAWPGALAGEMVAAAVGALWARRAAGMASGRDSTIVRNENRAQPDSDGHAAGRWLLLALLASSVPVYLDRLFVAAILGSEAAGQYGFMMLFIMGALTLAGIVVQKVGPALVLSQHAGATVREQWGTVRNWVLGQAGLVAVGTLIAGVLVLHGPLEFLGLRYRLEFHHFAATALLGVLQGTVLLDWLLLSHDGERRVFMAAITYLFAALVFAAFLALSNATLLQVISALALAKLVHATAQAILIATLPSKQPSAGAA